MPRMGCSARRWFVAIWLICDGGCVTEAISGNEQGSTGSPQAHHSQSQPRPGSLLRSSGRYNARVVAGFLNYSAECEAKRYACEGQPVPLCMLEESMKPQIQNASLEGVDIIVFPETYYSAPVDFRDRCSIPPAEELLPGAGPGSLCPETGEPSTWWGTVACWAKRFHVLVVFGAYDWGACNPSPNPFTHRSYPCVGNMSIFNKALAFGVDGQLLVVKHKHHLAHGLLPQNKLSTKTSSGLVVNTGPLNLLNDDPAAQWPVPDPAIFTSHFGVTFGIMICHELNFASPVLSLLKAGVRDILFPTMWGGHMGGNFQGTQSGFAVAHGVNFIVANGLPGGSGLWPADPSAVPVQFPVSNPPPGQWLATLELHSPRQPLPAQPAVPPPPANRPVSNVTHVSLPPWESSSAEVSLGGIACRLDTKMAGGVGKFIFGVSRGINFAGMFESTCWFVSCGLIANRIGDLLTPDMVLGFFMPFTVEDVEFCDEQLGGLAVAEMTVHIKTAEVNRLLPIGHCLDGSVPVPRPYISASKEEGGWRSLALAPSCPLDYAAVRGFAQSEFGLPSCPDGFCPSPSPCSNTTWETTDGATCVLVEGEPGWQGFV